MFGALPTRIQAGWPPRHGKRLRHLRPISRLREGLPRGLICYLFNSISRNYHLRCSHFFFYQVPANRNSAGARPVQALNAREKLFSLVKPAASAICLTDLAVRSSCPLA
jgi:hypothetical protein